MEARSMNGWADGTVSGLIQGSRRGMNARRMGRGRMSSDCGGEKKNVVCH